MQAILDAPNWLIILTIVLIFIGVPALFLALRYLSWWEYTHRDARIRSRYRRWENSRTPYEVRTGRATENPPPKRKDDPDLVEYDDAYMPARYYKGESKPWQKPMSGRGKR